MGRSYGKVGVVGLGTMGAGIAEVFARAGVTVVGAEPEQESLARGRGHLERSTGRAVRRGRLSEEDRRAVLDRVHLTTRLEDLADVDLVVEAVPERFELKRTVFATLDRVCGPDTVLATNTSSLSVTEIAGVTQRPELVVGMHFFNPAPVLKLVEVVTTARTEPGLVDEVAALSTRLGKRPVVVSDRAGFVANALLFGYLNAAIRTVQAGVASREDVDLAMTRGVGLPMGPLALLDLIGLDTSYGVLESMYAESRDRLVAPAPLLRQLVTAGMLGRKTGRGFYAYVAPGSPEVVADTADTAGLALPLPGAPLGQARADQARKDADQARAVERVAVIGAAPEAAELATRFNTSGYDAVLLPVTAATEPDALSDRGLVIAMVDEGDQRELFSTLDDTCPAGAVLAQGSRFGAVAEAAGATRRPAEVVGLRLTVPPMPPKTPLSGDAPPGAVLEVAITTATSPMALATVAAVGERLGVPVVVCRDRPGRLIDALLVPYLNAAVALVQDGYASADDVDTAMRLGCGYPAGPVQMIEAVGLDVAAAVMAHLFAQSGEPGLAPAPLLTELVALGRRTITPPAAGA